MILIETLTVHSGTFCLRNVSFQVDSGKYAVLMGKTGCGKTSLLEAICGLRKVTSGSIVLCGRDVTHLRPAERGVGYVPQDLALFPSMTVREHLSFALEIRRRPQGEIERRTTELAELLGIAHLLSRYPQGLSGGESQRVALGRALAFLPQALLLDEPLCALDEDTRGAMGDLLRSVQKQTGVTTIHVTHSLTEAKHLADQVLVLRPSGIEVEAL